MASMMTSDSAQSSVSMETAYTTMSAEVKRKANVEFRGRDVFDAAACGSLNLKRDLKPNKHGLGVLHLAALYGQLECIKRLLDAGDVVDVNACCPHGRTPIHMILTAQSRPNTHACLTYLLKHGARTDVVTDEGLTPLHLSAAEGLRDCTETLVRHKADAHARDNRGHTALDLARIWGHRAIARFLKDAMWKTNKEHEMERVKQLHDLRQDLLVTNPMSREPMLVVMVRKKHHPMNVSQTSRHVFCKPAEPETPNNRRTCHQAQLKANWNISPIPSKPPARSMMRTHSDRFPSEPDVCSVRFKCWKDGRPRYIASWKGIEHLLPDLPLNDLLKGLSPSAFPSRIQSPRDFQSSSVLDLPRLGRISKPNGSPWTEVAMHLTEDLQPGHYYTS